MDKKNCFDKEQKLEIRWRKATYSDTIES